MKIMLTLDIQSCSKGYPHSSSQFAPNFQNKVLKFHTTKCSRFFNLSFLPKLYIMKGHPIGQKKKKNTNIQFLWVVLLQVQSGIPKKVEHFFSTACEAATARILGTYLSKQSDSDKLQLLSAIFLSRVTQLYWGISSPGFHC